MITINMEKARNIKKDKIREEREPLLKQLDTDYIRALEIEDTNLQSAIKSKKQMLRDATIDPSIENAETPEELSAAQPISSIMENNNE